MARLLASIARLHIVAIGALGTFTFTWGLTGVYSLALTILSACDWFVVNLLNRVVDLEEDAANGILGADVVKANQRRTVVVGLLVLGLSLAFSAVVMPWTLPARLAFHTLGFAYNWRLIPTPSGRRRIKTMAFWKNTASATGFLLTCFVMPVMAFTPTVGVGTIVATMVFFFFFELSYEVLYDLRDADGDRLAGVNTWPVLFGNRVAAAIAVGQMVLAFVVAVAAFAVGVLPWHLAVMAVAPLLQLLLVLRSLPNGVTSRLCIGITWFGAALLGTFHLWELTGLPGSSAHPLFTVTSSLSSTNATDATDAIGTTNATSVTRVTTEPRP